MLNFFRKIRRSFLDSGRTSKYFIYAIGEILLVMIGILLALQVNNWNTNRINKKQENLILHQLKEEFTNNKNQLESKIFVRNEMISSCSKIISYLDAGISKLNIDSLDFHLNHSVYRPTFDPALGVTNELLNSGKLYLITNLELRKIVTNWSGIYVDELKEEEDLVVDLIVREFYPFLIENYQVMNMSRFSGQSKLFGITHFDMEEASIPSISSSSSDGNWSSLVDNEDFIDYLVVIIDFTYSANTQSIAVLEKINEALHLIENEINN